MNIYAKSGTKVRFKGDICKEQIQWGSHTNPAGILEKGKEYTIEKTEVHSEHTRVFLKGYEGMHFNSVWFEEV